MRKIIFESLLHGPLTEPSPGADAAALAEIGAAFERVARKRFGRSLAIRESVHSLPIPNGPSCPSVVLR